MILYCTDSFIHYSIGDPNGVYCCDRYDNLERCIPDAFTHLLEEIHHTEMELSHLPQKWKVLWDKLELPTTDSLTVSVLASPSRKLQDHRQGSYSYRLIILPTNMAS